MFFFSRHEEELFRATRECARCAYILVGIKGIAIGFAPAACTGREWKEGKKEEEGAKTAGTYDACIQVASSKYKLLSTALTRCFLRYVR